MRARHLRPARPVAPPLAYAGEREAVRAELAEVEAKLRRNAPGSIYRPPLERHRCRLVARLLDLGEPAAPEPGQDRKDFQ